MRNERKPGYPPSHSYDEHCKGKNRNIFAHNLYSTKIKGPKKIWVSKVEKSNYDADMFDNLNYKCDIDSGSLSHTSEEKICSII